MAHPALSTSSSVLSSAPSEASLVRDVGEVLAQYSPSDERDKTRLVLQSFLSELPPEGSNNIRQDIKDCNTDQDLRDLASHLVFHILAPLKAKSRTPSVEPSPCPGWVESVESVATEITSSQRQQMLLRKLCLERDGKRCVLSGIYDHSQWRELPVGDQIRASERAIRTQAAHIVPFCCGSFDKSGLQKASATWDALWRAFPSMRSLVNFGPDQINNPYNALTLASTLHVEFGNFYIALESTNTPGTYRIYKHPDLSIDASSLLPQSGTVTFTGTTQIPAPHPVLLEAHAAVARILHMTVMAETIENVLRDRELVPCLAVNGSTDVGYLLMAF